MIKRYFFKETKSSCHSSYQFPKVLSEMSLTNKAFFVLHWYFSSFGELLLGNSIQAKIIFYHIPKGNHSTIFLLLSYGTKKNHFLKALWCVETLFSKMWGKIHIWLHKPNLHVAHLFRWFIHYHTSQLNFSPVLAPLPIQVPPIKHSEGLSTHAFPLAS